MITNYLYLQFKASQKNNAPPPSRGPGWGGWPPPGPPAPWPTRPGGHSPPRLQSPSNGGEPRRQREERTVFPFKVHIDMWWWFSSHHSKHAETWAVFLSNLASGFFWRNTGLDTFPEMGGKHYKQWTKMLLENPRGKQQKNWNGSFSYPKIGWESSMLEMASIKITKIFPKFKTQKWLGCCFNVFLPLWSTLFAAQDKGRLAVGLQVRLGFDQKDGSYN